ncbi:MAG: hypothetical protein ACPGLV_03990, partial [Bacteroidia bacterium]
MKILLPFYLIVSLLVLSSCNPVLYQPNSPNIPMVDTTERTNIKTSASFRSIDLQFTRLTTSNKLIQSSFTISDVGKRISLGSGSIKIGNNRNTFTTYGLSFTDYTNKERFHFDEYEIIEQANNFPSSSKIQSKQIMCRYMLGYITHPKPGSYKFQSATALEFELCFAPKISYITTHRTINEPFEWKEGGEINNHLYGIISVHQQFSIYKSLTLTLGSRLPILGLTLPNEFMYYTTELVYVKAGISI